jgi:hypothetical protein
MAYGNTVFTPRLLMMIGLRQNLMDTSNLLCNILHYVTLHLSIHRSALSLFLVYFLHA